MTSAPRPGAGLAPPSAARGRSIARRLGGVAVLVAMGIGGAACDGSPATCRVAGVSHRAGERFPAPDGCNTCSCTATGEAACTLLFCSAPDAGLAPDGSVDQGADQSVDRASDLAVDQASDGATCDFASSYEYGWVGGYRAYAERSFLSPGNQYRHTRTGFPVGASASLMCAPALPACGGQDVITAYDLEVRDLPLADVQGALAQATPPLYGLDPRPFDGAVFELERADGRGFLVGSPCPAGAAPGCTGIPAGIARLKQRLIDLDTQQLARPGCEGFHTP